jgi:hypothetical protein
MDDLNFLIYFIHQPLNSSFLEHQLHHGLSHVCQLVLSKPKYRPLPLPDTSNNNQQPRRATNLLTSDLENVYVDRERYDRWDMSKRLLAVYDDADERQYLRKPIIPGSDPGPEEVWRWAHDLEPVMYFVAGYAQEPLRAWGYVFWDQLRLERWNVYSKDWQGMQYHQLVEKEARKAKEFQEQLERSARKNGIQIKDVAVRL